MTTLAESVTRAQFDARQHARRLAVMSAHRQARRDAIEQARNAEPDATDYFNATDYSTRADALEARYWLLRHDRDLVVATMAHEPHNGSRAAMVRPTNLPQVETVNATEVRMSERWRLDRPSQVKWPTKWDGTCYSITPDGRKVAFTVATDETTPRKRVAQVSATDERNARRRAIAGTIRMGEQD